MNDLAFFHASAVVTLAAVATEADGRLPPGIDPTRILRAAAPLDRAGAFDLSVFHDDLSVDALRSTRAGACLVEARHLDEVPAGTVAIVTARPRRAFSRVARILHPDCARPGSSVDGRIVDPTAKVDPDARLEAGVVIDPGALVGPRVEIGAGTFVGALCVIGAGVRIGRDCAIASAVVLSHALVGDRVVIHPGARIGQGEGPIGSARGDPMLGRVIVQNDVEIGANATIARGGLADTVIGEGSRIGTLVAIGADVVIERNATIVAPGSSVD